MDTAAETYAMLRRCGSLTLPVHEASVISTLRRLAKADGLALVQSRQRAVSRQSSYSKRQRPYYVGLVRPTDPTTVYAPDASKEA